MNYAVIVDFSKENHEYMIKQLKSKSEAFIAIESVENEARNNAVEQSTLEKPYVCKMSNKRFGFLIPKSYHNTMFDYISAAIEKIQKKHGLEFNGKLDRPMIEKFQKN